MSEGLLIFQQNNIPIVSPALTDGALGDTLYFHSYKNPGLVIDIVEGKYILVSIYTVASELCKPFVYEKLFEMDITEKNIQVYGKLD